MGISDGRRWSSKYKVRWEAQSVHRLAMGSELLENMSRAVSVTLKPDHPDLSKSVHVTAGARWLISFCLVGLTSRMGCGASTQPGRAEGWADVGSIRRWFECGRCLNESNAMGPTVDGRINQTIVIQQPPAPPISMLFFWFGSLVRMDETNQNLRSGTKIRKHNVEIWEDRG